MTKQAGELTPPTTRRHGKGLAIALAACLVSSAACIDADDEEASIGETASVLAALEGAGEPFEAKPRALKLF